MACKQVLAPRRPARRRRRRRRRGRWVLTDGSAPRLQLRQRQILEHQAALGVIVRLGKAQLVQLRHGRRRGRVLLVACRRRLGGGGGGGGRARWPGLHDSAIDYRQRCGGLSAATGRAGGRGCTAEPLTAAACRRLLFQTAGTWALTAAAAGAAGRCADGALAAAGRWRRVQPLALIPLAGGPRTSRAGCRSCAKPNPPQAAAAGSRARRPASAEPVAQGAAVPSGAGAALSLGPGIQCARVAPAALPQSTSSPPRPRSCASPVPWRCSPVQPPSPSVPL